MLKLPKNKYDKNSIQAQRTWIETKTDTLLHLLTPKSPMQYRGLSENIIGEMAIPLSVAGPLLIKGSTISGEYYLPICSLEGSLVLSLTRGLLLCSLCGGIETVHNSQKMNRSPVFKFTSLAETQRFKQWIDLNFSKIKTIAESTTQHGKLINIECHTISTNVIVNFIYTTGDAAGQNMVTIATQDACHYIVEKYPSNQKLSFLIESNYSGDKNSTFNNTFQGRGHSVTAHIALEDSHIKRIFRTTGNKMLEGFNMMTQGSIHAGSLGNNLHCANALAALYLALGQDIGCVAENACGIFIFEERDNKYTASLKMNSLSIGSVGGATRLPFQKSNLEMIGCYGKDKAASLAEIICASALALELSLAGAIVSNEFSRAHQTYGR